MGFGQILIVDDNTANLSLLVGILQEQGYVVRIANSGRRALAAVRTNPPELIMLDISMPEMDGYEVCAALKGDTTTRDIPIIFISAIDDVLDKVKSFRIGGVDYVTKPFHREEVVARVESQLKISRLRRQLEDKHRDLEFKQEELERRNAELERKNRELLQSQREKEAVFFALSNVLTGLVLDEKYQLEEKIGTGGFGAVYRARHLGLNRQVAVKVLGPGSSAHSDTERLRLEGMAACRVNHPNAVAVLDFGVASAGVPYLVMELLEGHTLADEMARCGWLPLARCAEILTPICDVLASAHQAGIVHRDIKPQNIFLHRTGDVETVKVLDFGVAKLFDVPHDQTSLTVTSQLIGTPIYISPERLLAEDYDGRSDVYSLGVMLYQMLCGQFPFEIPDRASQAILFNRIMTEKPVPLGQHLVNISPQIEAAVMRALEYEPALRPAPREFADEFLIAAGLDVAPGASGSPSDPTQPAPQKPPHAATLDPSLMETTEGA